MVAIIFLVERALWGQEIKSIFSFLLSEFIQITFLPVEKLTLPSAPPEDPRHF